MSEKKILILILLVCILAATPLLAFFSYVSLTESYAEHEFGLHAAHYISTLFICTACLCAIAYIGEEMK